MGSVVQNRKSGSGKAFAPDETKEAVESVGPVTYSNAWDRELGRLTKDNKTDQKFCDCAGFVDAVIANLQKMGGTLSPESKGGPKTINDWLQEGKEDGSQKVVEREKGP